MDSTPSSAATAAHALRKLGCALLLTVALLVFPLVPTALAALPQGNAVKDPSTCWNPPAMICAPSAGSR